ncbi:MAG: hypothetical protein MUF64_07555 [Polyangiaceae bacterium]|jgi:hypothetical protein|nr:hypothetical protein [Polyangiaceae bacterium]
MERARQVWVKVTLLAAVLFAAAAAAVRLAGFESISDDDHARVVLAQAFARAPRLDPSGSSWLPAPFWLQGAWLALLGLSLRSAHVFAIVSAGVAGALLSLAARFSGLSPRGAVLALALALALPLSSLLGAAPVPELLVAALVSCALLHLVHARQASLDRWLLASFALLLASLSRYEAWIPALVFALAAAFHARQRPSLLLCVALAVAGPVGWVLWNLHAHGDPFSFARKVAAYRAGLGERSQGVLSYPLALLREAPVALVLGLLAVRLRPLRWPLLGALGLVLGLAAAELRGGAPTHHPERALLAPIFVLLLAATSVVEKFSRNDPRTWLLVCALHLGVCGLRWGPAVRGLGAPRRQEVALGMALREALPPGEKALWAARSYGFFALQAALGRPGAVQVVVPRSVDPRSRWEADPLGDPRSLDALVGAFPGARWLLLLDGDAPWIEATPRQRLLPGARLVPLF